MIAVLCRLVLLGAVCLPSSAADFHWADAVVYGDAPAAYTAAIQLKRSGHDVLLVSPVAHIGGMMVEGLGSQDVDGRSGSGKPIGGLAREFYIRVGREYTPGTNTPKYKFDSSKAEAAIDKWLVEAGVRQLRGKRISEAAGAVRKTATRITDFVTEDGTRIAGKVFIDATVEGDLMAFSGVEYTWGREPNSKYGENVNGVYPAAKDQFNVTVDPYVVPGNPASGVIVGVQNEAVGTKGEGDRSVMGFCLRLPLTKDPANKIPITAPPGYDVSRYELYKRFLEAGGINDWLDGPGAIDASTTTKLIDLGSWHNLSGNLYGRNFGYPDGSYAERQAIYQEHKNYTQGLIYYLSNDPGVPEAVRNEWSRWGLPADEFTDNGGWPRRLYVRSARRMISDYVITEKEVRATPVGVVTPAPAVTDPIGICWWPIDLHNARTVIKDGKVWNEGAYFDLVNYKPFGMSYRAIVPKRTQCTNLLAPMTLSSSYLGYGAVRLEWTFMVLGQSAAAAAGIALDRNLDVQDVPYDVLAPRLLADSQVLFLPETLSGIVVDNGDLTGVQISGSWTESAEVPGFQGTGYLHDDQSGKGAKSIRFTPGIPEAGIYQVQAKWSARPNRANNVPVSITHAGGVAAVTANQQADDNVWKLLGTYSFNAGTGGHVLISNTGTAGYVIADAVRFVRTHQTAAVTVSISALNGAATEHGTRPARLTVFRTGGTTAPLQVNLGSQGNALSGADYAPLPSSVTIPADSKSVEFPVTPVSDTVVEGDETVSVSVLAGTGYTPGPNLQASVVIRDRPFDAWRKKRFNPAELADPSISGSTADPDGNGSGNLMEFVLGGTFPPPSAKLDDSAPDARTLDLEFWRSRDKSGAMLVPKVSATMETWSTDNAPEEILDFDPATDRVKARYRLQVPLGAKRFFARLDATEE